MQSTYLIMEFHCEQKTLIKPSSCICVAKQPDGVILISSCKLSFLLLVIVPPTLLVCPMFVETRRDTFVPTDIAVLQLMGNLKVTNYTYVSPCLDRVLVVTKQERINDQ